MSSLPMRAAQRRFAVVLIPALLLVAALSLLVWLPVHRALRDAHRAVEAQSHLGFQLAALDGETMRAGNPGFDTVGAADDWDSGAAVEGELFLAGPAGLVERSPAGEIVRRWRRGTELPPVSLRALVAGRLRGSSGPEVAVGTAGAGVLLLTPAGQPGMRQLLPDRAELRDVTALAIDPTGQLLIGTRAGGVVVWDGSELRPAPIAVAGIDARGLAVTALAADGETVLIGTRDSGVLLSHGGVTDHLRTADGLPDEEVDSLALAAGHGFVGTPVGVAELDLSRERVERVVGEGLFAHRLAVLPAEPGRVATDKTLVVGTMDQGIQLVALGLTGATGSATGGAAGAAVGHLQRASIEVSAPRATGRTDAVSPVFALVDGRLLLRSGGHWQPAARAAGGLTDGNVAALVSAPDGELWVGLFDRGLDIFSADGTGVRHLEDDHLFCVNRLVVDPVRGTVAAGTANGLVLFDQAGRPRQTLLRADGLIADHVNDLVFTAGGMAVATPAGITFFDRSGPSSLYAFEGLVNNHVYTLASLGTGELLAGTLGGISLLRDEQVERSWTAMNSGLRHNWITASVAEAPGRWLIGTYGAGVEEMTEGPGGQVRFAPVELPAGVPQDLVVNPNALLRTASATYAGTLGHGLLVGSGGRWTLVDRGLPSLNVTAFAVRGGVLYVGTDSGLVSIPEQRLLGAHGGGGLL